MNGRESHRCCASNMRRIKIVTSETIKEVGQATVYKRNWLPIGWLCLCCKRVMHTHTIKGNKTYTVWMQDGVAKTWVKVGKYNLSNQIIVIDMGVA